MSVRTYNPSVRVGNWNEDLCLEEDLLKDFLDKKDKGELMIQKASNLLKTILKEIRLSSPSDGYIHVGDAICLLHVPTQSIVSAYMSAAQAHEAKQIVSNCSVTCSKSLQSCPRNIFIVGSYSDPDVKQGDVIRFGQQLTLTTLPDEGGKLCLESDRATFMEHSKHTREQEVKLRDEVSYRAVWKIQCFKQEDRLESEGIPVPANEQIFITHCKTNQHLCVHSEWTHRTPFGREYEVTACTKFDSHKAEDLHNHFMLVTGDPQELAATLNKS